MNTLKSIILATTLAACASPPKPEQPAMPLHARVELVDSAINNFSKRNKTIDFSLEPGDSSQILRWYNGVHRELDSLYATRDSLKANPYYNWEEHALAEYNTTAAFYERFNGTENKGIFFAVVLAACAFVAGRYLSKDKRSE